MRRGIVGKLNKYFTSLKEEEITRISRILKEEIQRLNIKYLSDSGKARDIQLVLRPWFIKPREMRFFHRLIYSFKAAHHKLCRMYLRSRRIQEIMPLTSDEKEWFGLINKNRFQKYQEVFGRWDTNVSFDERDNIRGIKFLETNTVGIGGIHYIPVVSEGIKEILRFRFEKDIRPYRLRFQADPRDLLAAQIKRHARLIGRRGLNVVFLENRDYLGGTVELPELAKYFLKKGIKAILADPRELRLKGGEIYHRDTNIDIIYRDSELQELIDIERKGHNMAVLKQAFVNNQVISSIAGELDHKSSFEIFTNPEFAGLFTAAERAVFIKYLPWTRVIKERKTPGIDSLPCRQAGRRIDLIPYVLKNQERLIIKPSRAYGGKGVMIGRLMEKSKWAGYVAKASRKPGGYVVQEAVDIREEVFPLFSGDGKIRFEKFYSVSGFVVTPGAIAVLGRFSKDMVVNVARKGGIIPAFLLSMG